MPAVCGRPIRTVDLQPVGCMDRLQWARQHDGPPSSFIKVWLTAFEELDFSSQQCQQFDDKLPYNHGHWLSFSCYFCSGGRNERNLMHLPFRVTPVKYST